MDIQNQHLADNAKSALENQRKEAEYRKNTMMREQKMRELKELETQLFYKKQEALRLKAVADRLKRELVVRQNTELKEKNEYQAEKQKLTETERKVSELNHNIDSVLETVNEKIQKEKQELQHNERVLEGLIEKEKQLKHQEETEKRKWTDSIGRLNFFKRSAEHNRSERELKQYEQKVIDIEKLLDIKRREIQVLEVSLVDIKRKISIENKDLLEEKNNTKKVEQQKQKSEQELKAFEQKQAQLKLALESEINKEKELIMQKQKTIQDLEKQKTTTMMKKDSEKKTISNLISNTLFKQKKEEQEYQTAERLFESNQRYLSQVTQSLKSFSQEVTVLENKIRALKSALK